MLLLGPLPEAFCASVVSASSRMCAPEDNPRAYTSTAIDCGRLTYLQIGFNHLAIQAFRSSPVGPENDHNPNTRMPPRHIRG